MSLEIVFARTGHEYQSYSDYWKLVELAKFPQCHVQDIDFGRELFYIITPINGEFRPHIKGQQDKYPGTKKKCKVAWWNLERPDSGEGALDQLLGTMVCNNTTDMLQWVDYIWVSDRYQYNLDPRTVFVPMGSHPGLMHPEVGKRRSIYDYCHMSYINYRRAGVFGELGSLSCGPNGWDRERSVTINKSRLMLNVHQTEAPIMEPLRLAVAAAHKIPVVSEYFADSYPIVSGHDVLVGAYKKLAATTFEVLKRAEDGKLDLQEYGDRLNNKLCNLWPFRSNVLSGANNSLAGLNNYWP